MKIRKTSIFPSSFQQFQRMGGNWRHFHIAHQLNDSYIKLSMKLRLIIIFVIIIFCQDLEGNWLPSSVTSIN